MIQIHVFNFEISRQTLKLFKCTCTPTSKMIIYSKTNTMMTLYFNRFTLEFLELFFYLDKFAKFDRVLDTD